MHGVTAQKTLFSTLVTVRTQCLVVDVTGVLLRRNEGRDGGAK
jgi:hypothetical protein